MTPPPDPLTHAPVPALRDLLPDGCRVRLHRYDLPLDEPFGISFETITETPGLLAVASDGRHEGYGEGAPLAQITGESRRDALEAVEDWAPNPSRLHRLGSPAARAAIEGALLDLAARREGLPLAELLGADAVEPVPTSVTVPLGGGDLGDRVQAALEAGTSIVKVKAGGDLSADLDRLARVREGAGSDASLRVDPNQGWTRTEALEALDTLEDLGVDLLEQPLETGDLAGHAALRDHTTIPVALDEDVHSPADVRRAVDAGAADVVNLKLTKTGGLRPALAAADEARAGGLRCMLGCMIESRVGIGLAAHLYEAHGAFGYADLDGPLFLDGDPVTGGPRLEAGAVHPTGGPGLDVDGVDAGDPVATLALP